MLSTLLLIASSPLLAQQPVDGTLNGAPASGPGTPSQAAPVVQPGPHKTTVTLTAIDSKSMSSSSDWKDNRFRAYWNSSLGFVDGFAKFDLSSIPDGSTITSMTLRAYHEYGFGNPHDNPEVRVYRCDDDSWTRGTTSTHPGLDVGLTGIHTGFPSADLVPVDFPLDVGATNWAGDLTDDRLTLVLRNEAGNVSRYSYVYFYGSDANPAPPELIIEYGGPTLSVSNLIGGQTATVEISGAPAGATCIVGWSWSGGPTNVSTPWGNFNVDLGLPINQLPSFAADASGYGSTSAFVPASVSGRTVYLHALVVSGGVGELTNSLVEVIG